MNRYDKEINIINDFQKLTSREIYLFNGSLSLRKIFISVYSKRKWKNWIDSSSKNEPPPDFYNDKLKIMMDVMRIDDHAYEDSNGKVLNPTNKRESQLMKEIASKNAFLKRAVEEGRVLVNPDSGLRGEKDHNYTFYYKNFERVTVNHSNKITNYKKNHPGYKTIFFILDESSPYLMAVNDYRPSAPGEIIYGIFHQWWRDFNMMKYIVKSDLDYIIWFSPYKHFDSLEKFEPPFATIIDVKKIRLDSLIKYTVGKMYSVET